MGSQPIASELEASEKRYRRLFETAQDGILILDAVSGKVVDVNPFLLKLLGYSYEEVSGQYLWDLGVFKDIAASKEAFSKLQDHEYIRYEDLPLESRDGRAMAVEFVSNVYLVDNVKVIQCNIRDITNRKQSEKERKRLTAALDQAGEAIVMTDAQGVIEFVNPAFEKATGYGAKEAVGQTPRILRSGKHNEEFYQELWATISGGETWKGQMTNRRKDGSLFTEQATISPVRDTKGKIVNYVAVKRDMTEQLRLEAQFQQAQKMEAVGLLAGGVAHDYNNMLSVILGYTELAMHKVTPEHALYGDLEEIYKAGMRSSDITRQLLAFARKQTIAPVVLDLNQSVEASLKMLRRLIGENVSLAWLPKSGLSPVKMDPMQIDQILANLCVNARDAIASVGKITIETGQTSLSDVDCAERSGLTPGDYVTLAISDDGCGMDKETLSHIFEPFFTRKEVGKGTGLGLSTVYGIVKQNRGFISVYSETGRGTTFKIYIPCQADGLLVHEEESKAVPLGRGETVLVVEDEASLLAMSQRILEALKYTVLTAGTPSEGIHQAQKHAGEIALLLTDVVMPEMSGRDLAVKLQTAYPRIQVLFMSGYTADVVAHQGVMEEGMSFIQKPFSMRDLALKVREVLDKDAHGITV